MEIPKVDNQIGALIEGLSTFLETDSCLEITRTYISDLIKIQGKLYEEAQRIATPIIEKCFKPSLLAVIENFCNLNSDQISVTNRIETGSFASFTINATFPQDDPSTTVHFLNFMQNALNSVINAEEDIYVYKNLFNSREHLKCAITTSIKVKIDDKTQTTTDGQLSEESYSITTTSSSGTKYYRLVGIPYIATFFVRSSS